MHACMYIHIYIHIYIYVYVDAYGICTTFYYYELPGSPHLEPRTEAPNSNPNALGVGLLGIETEAWGSQGRI